MDCQASQFLGDTINQSINLPNQAIIQLHKKRAHPLRLVTPTLPFPFHNQKKMGVVQEQETNAPLTPMDPFPQNANSNQHDPPPYVYTPVSNSSPDSPARSPSPQMGKTVLVPPPQETSRPLYRLPDNPTQQGVPIRVLDSRD